MSNNQFVLRGAPARSKGSLLLLERCSQGLRVDRSLDPEGDQEGPGAYAEAFAEKLFDVSGAMRWARVPSETILIWILGAMSSFGPQ